MMPKKYQLLVLVLSLIALVSFYFIQIYPRITNIPVAFVKNIPGDLKPSRNVKSNTIYFHKYSRAHMRIKGIPFSYSVNSLGFRGPDTVVSPDSKKVFITGDGYAFGVGLNNGETIAEKLEIELDNHYGKGGFTVLNAGVPGYTLSDTIDFIYDRGHKLEPYLTVVIVSSDSIWRMLRPGLFRERLRESIKSPVHLIKWVITSRAYFFNDKSLAMRRYNLSEESLFNLACKLYAEKILELDRLVKSWEGRLFFIVIPPDVPDLLLSLRQYKLPFVLADQIVGRNIQAGSDLGSWRLDEGHFNTRATSFIAKSLREWIVDQKN
jgi:hypothetical protein